MMEGSKTGKAAEADLIIGVGCATHQGRDEHARNVYISKNKITGYHGLINCMINPELSRYYD
jgi:hypothetical protein